MRAHVVAVSLLAMASLSAPRAAAAQGRDQQRDSAAVRANKGFQLGLGPELLIPTDGGPLGGGVVLDARYGFRARPAILAPGARFAGDVISERVVGIAMPTFRLTLTAGPFAPFVQGGAGGGWLSNPGEGGVALLGGGGLVIHFGRILAIGAEVNYQVITETEFRTIGFGPMLQLGPG